MKNILKASIIKLSVVICLLFAGYAQVHAQADPRQLLNDIYKKYDSLEYLTFDVNYSYSTDTLYGDFHNESMAGTYTLAGKRAKYTIGDIEFLQNESYFIAVYNKEKFIIVGDPRTANTASELPVRSLMDSMVQVYGQHYNINTYEDTLTGIISFERADSLAQFDRFSVTYDPDSKYLRAVEYSFRENQQTAAPEDTIASNTEYKPLPVIERKKSLRIEFSNYRIDNFSPDSYSENAYVWFEDGECKPVEKYKDYKIYDSRSGTVGTEVPVPAQPQVTPAQ